MNGLLRRIMSSKIICVLVVLASTCALTAGAARADDDERSSIAFRAENVRDATACGNALFGLSFDMVSLRGVPLGTGTTCVHTFDGCSFAAGCRARIQATFTLEFGRGSLTAAMALREVWPTDVSFIQRVKGRITAGTGEFDDLRGRVKGGGTGVFTDQGIDPDLVYVVRLTENDDDD
jgi:hypothetical protein